MNKLYVLIISAMFAVSSHTLFAQEEDMGMDPEMMKAWQEYMTPGPNHAILEQLVGEWKTEIKSWMAPDLPPTTTEGKSVYESILGARYIQSVEKATFMDMPFEGRAISGFDKATDKFFTCWVDNMGTGVMVAEGTYDEATKTLTYTGSGMSFTGEYKVREILKWINDNQIHFEMYMEEGGKPEMKMMEIEYTRIK